MFAASSLILTVTDQMTDSAKNSAARVLTSERFGFIEALNGAVNKPLKNGPSVSLSTLQSTDLPASEKLRQALAAPKVAAKTSSPSEGPVDLLTRGSRSEMPTHLDKLRETLGSLKGFLKQSMESGSAASDVGTLSGKFTKAVSEFDYEAGTTLLATLNTNQQSFPGLENSDWSLIPSSGETDQTAALSLLKQIDWALSKDKSPIPVVGVGNRAVLSPRLANSEKTPSFNANFLSADVANRAEAATFFVEEVPKGQTVNYLAEFRSNPSSMTGMARDQPGKGQDAAVRTQVSLPSNGSGAGVSSEWTPTSGNMYAQRNAQTVNQSLTAEPGFRSEPTLKSDVSTGRSIDRPSGRRVSNASGAVDFDPRIQASLATAGARSKLGIQAPVSAVPQINQNVVTPREFGIVDSSLFREADILMTPEQGQNGSVSGLPAAEVKTERSTLLTAQAARPTGFSIALTEQMRGITFRDGVTKVQLSPRGLGTIEVEMATDVDSTTNIVIRSDNSVVLSALKDVRDLVTQVLNLDSGGTLRFEESTGNGDTQSGEDPQDQERENHVSPSAGVLSGGVGRIDVIGSDVLDIMA